MKVALVFFLGMVALSTASKQTEEKLLILKRLLRKVLDSDLKKDLYSKNGPIKELPLHEEPVSKKDVADKQVTSKKKLLPKNQSMDIHLGGHPDGGHQPGSNPLPRPHHQPPLHPEPAPHHKPVSYSQITSHGKLAPHYQPIPTLKTTSHPQPDPHPKLDSRPHSIPSFHSGSGFQQGSVSGSQLTPHPEHKVDMFQLPASGEPGAVPLGGAPSIPLPILAFITSSPHMKAAPLTPDDLSNEVANFGTTLEHVTKALHNVAADVRKTTEFTKADSKLLEDMEALEKEFLPAQREAATGLFRVMVYGVTGREVCKLNAENVVECVLKRLEVLAKMFTRPLHMDRDGDKMERCNKFFKDTNGGKVALASDITCVANGVSNLLQLVNKMKATSEEIQLVSRLNEHPLPKFITDLDAVNTEVAKDLEVELKAIMSEVLRLMMDINNMISVIH